MALTARSETQRVTDAASLAGASAFFDLHWEDDGVVSEAVNRGKAYAAANVVRGASVDTTSPPRRRGCASGSSGRTCPPGSRSFWA
jgi:hypothetical protein